MATPAAVPAAARDVELGNGKEIFRGDETNDLRRQIQWLETQLESERKAKQAAYDEYGFRAQAAQFRPIANPGPLGLFGFGLTTALLQGSNTAWTEASTEYITFGYALAFGGLVQLLAGMWEFVRNNMFAAVAFSSYGGFWLGFGLWGTLSAAGVLPTIAPHGLQMLLCLWGIFTFLLWISTFRINRGLQALFLFLTVTFFLLAAGATRGAGNNCTKAGGYFGVATAGIAWYIAFAELTNEVYRRVVLPVGVVSWETKEAPPNRPVRRPDTL